MVEGDEALLLIARQLVARACLLDELYPRWNTGLEWYRLAVRYLATVVAEESVWARLLLERLGFWERLETAGSVEEVIDICYDVWRESEGVLDLCP